jgi:hypothetical protein
VGEGSVKERESEKGEKDIECGEGAKEKLVRKPQQKLSQLPLASG